MTGDPQKRRKAFLKGHSAERLASFVLMLKGFRIVERRFKTRLGEIDLIARRGSLVLIVEVKARPTLESAMEAVTFTTQRRIEGASDLWLARQPDRDRLSLRYDLIAILPRRWPVHVAAAYQARY